MKKKIFVLVLCVVFLSGCWDRKELNEIGIIVGVAVDKDLNTNQIILTCEAIKTSNLKKGESQVSSTTEYVSVKGATIYDAIRNCSKKFDRKIFFSHDKVIIISENLARDGIAPILDAFVRDYETRPLVWLIVAKDKDINETLSVKHGIEAIQGLYLRDIISKEWATSEVQATGLIDFYKKMLGKGTNPIAGAAEVINDFKNPNGEDSREISLSGAAAFKKDKFVGYLNDKETRGYNWITNQVKSGVINVPGITNKSKLIAVEIKRAGSNIKSEMLNGNYIFNINVVEEGNIGEVQDTTDVTDPAIQEKIEKEQEEEIKQEIKMAIKKAKEDFKCDIFGFGNVLYRSNPKQWEKVKDSWNDVFIHAEYNINVKATYKKTGEILKPFNTKE
ncbi:spore germination protein KC [Clostridium acidisoli DSM 12555]|uniref:Spore germination protein KC n=1 Tax=Clostridium acidisoli DSM 12555 TaxID=1121291 RepID=A0A1W1XSM5_9CLOT|nr:Ger(x)C family spore germination protein [Clostridium acidisoli]SMC26959.1 spore germination protein KC [Clostridium acidisoli DSM 12555]